jgi:hypothetical protein
MGALVAARTVESFIFFGVPHVVGPAGKLFLKFFAGYAAELFAKPFYQFFAFLEVVDTAAGVELVAIPTELRAERHEPAGQCPASPLPHQSAATGKSMAGLDRIVIDNTDRLLDNSEHTLRAATIVQLVAKRLLIGLLCQYVFCLAIHTHLLYLYIRVYL